MYRRLILPAMLGLVAVIGASPVALHQPILDTPILQEIRRTSQRRIRFGRSPSPRTRRKHERQKPPHKNCQHRKPARARRRAARLRRSRT